MKKKEVVLKDKKKKKKKRRKKILDKRSHGIRIQKHLDLPI